MEKLQHTTHSPFPSRFSCLSWAAQRCKVQVEGSVVDCSVRAACDPTRIWVRFAGKAVNKVPAVVGTANVNRWRKKDRHCGVTYKWTWVRKDPIYPVHTDRANMAKTIVAKFPKMSYLLKILADKCLDKKEKVLILMQFPMPQSNFFL